MLTRSMNIKAETIQCDSEGIRAWFARILHWKSGSSSHIWARNYSKHLPSVHRKGSLRGDVIGEDGLDRRHR